MVENIGFINRQKLYYLCNRPVSECNIKIRLQNEYTGRMRCNKVRACMGLFYGHTHTMHDKRTVQVRVH